MRDKERAGGGTMTSDDKPTYEECRSALTDCKSDLERLMEVAVSVLAFLNSVAHPHGDPKHDECLRVKTALERELG